MKQITQIAATVFSLCLVAAACGGSDDDVTDEGNDSAPDTSADSGEVDASTGDDADGADEVDTNAAGDVAATIAFTAPEGMDPTSIGVSPDGSQVAVSFSAPPGALATPGEVVVWDVDAGSEAWRVSLEDTGIGPLGDLMFTSAGVTGIPFFLEGPKLITMSDGQATTIDISGDAVNSTCGQFLNGAVHPTENVAYTVTPGGACRLDLSSGAGVSIAVSDIVPDSALVDSIRFDAAGDLILTFADPDFNTVSLAVDPVSLQVLDDTPRNEPLSPADVYGDRLVEGVLMSTDSRVAGSADGSTVAIIQPGAIEIIR